MLSKLALLFVIALIPLILAQDYALFQADLSAAQTVPRARMSSNSGKAILRFNYGSRKLTWNLEHTVWDAVSGSINGPAEAGENGPVIVDIDEDDLDDATVTGSATLSSRQQDDLFRGLMYIVIGSRTYPNGDTRGQIIRSRATFRVGLDAKQQTPPVRSDAVGTGVMSYDHETRVLSYTITHNVLQPTAAHIHGPADPGESANVTNVFNNGNQNTMNGQFVLNDAQEQMLLEDRMYVNVHSTQFPDGEIRGQIKQSDVPDFDDGTSGWVIAAIVIAVIAGIALVAVLAVSAVKKAKQRRAAQSHQRLGEENVSA